jgi:penicillin-binding protein 1C
MDFLHAGVRSRAPAPPPGLVRAWIAPWPGAQREHEWFIKGTEPAGEGQALGEPAAKIVEPAPGTIVALDPDIPAQNQRMFFAALGGAPGLRWRLDGADLGPASPDYGWNPAPGRHALALLDAAGRVLDETRFEVRGAIMAGAEDFAEPQETPGLPAEL